MLMLRAGAEEEEGKASTSRRKWIAPKVKTLTAEDCEKHSIFDVVMPLPGKDVAFPGGALGEKYREYLRRDGLDPDNFHRRQKYVLRLLQSSACADSAFSGSTV